jgi:hypothetical protein
VEKELVGIKFVLFQDMLDKHGRDILPKWYLFSRDDVYIAMRDKRGNISLEILYDKYEEFLLLLGDT